MSGKVGMDVGYSRAQDIALLMGGTVAFDRLHDGCRIGVIATSNNTVEYRVGVADLLGEESERDGFARLLKPCESIAG